MTAERRDFLRSAALLGSGVPLAGCLSQRSGTPTTTGPLSQTTFSYTDEIPEQLVRANGPPGLQNEAIVKFSDDRTGVDILGRMGGGAPACTVLYLERADLTTDAVLNVVVVGKERSGISRILHSGRILNTCGNVGKAYSYNASIAARSTPIEAVHLTQHDDLTGKKYEKTVYPNTANETESATPEGHCVRAGSVRC